MLVNSDVGRFAHDIATPLTMVKLNLDKLKNENSLEEPPLRIHLIERIEAGIDELSYLVTMNSQIKTPTVFRSTVIKEINKILRLYDLPFSKYKIDVKFEFNEDYFLIKSIDKFHRIIINLINNAVSALETVNHQRILLINTERVDNGFLLTISDNGCGIKPENLSRLFVERFTTKSDGNGLGLITVQKVLFEYFNGIITYNSVVGKGTTFEILIPDLE